MSRRGRGGAPALSQLAGWLFADLLLMLVVVVLGGQSSARNPVADASASPSAPATAPTSAAPSTAAPTASSPPGLDPHSVSVSAPVDPDALINGSAAARADLGAKVRELIRPYLPRQAALVIVWGSAGGCRGCPPDLGRSKQLADAVAPLVHDFAPDFFPPYDPKIIRGYYDGEGGSDTVRFELFFIRA
ncbi:hypothetical protein GCM10009665_31320 [Kitasatospora nipponensis]|uniref:Uncharacterized protein n=1 Tax=Kitasatospora nipponensis TaxID=258049 RepID=A0ABN1W772_9ACTN